MKESMVLRDVIIVSGARTPIGKFGQAFKNIPATELGSIAIKATMERAGITPDVVEDVIMGVIHQEGMGNNPCRIASLKAGIPYTSGALNVNNICSSGMKAVEIAARQIQLGVNDIIIAGGMESNSQCPHMLLDLRWGHRLNNGEIVDALFYDGFTDIHGIYGGYKHVGETAENIIKKFDKIYEKYEIPRVHLSFEEINEFAFNSHLKYQKARQEHFFREIIPVEIMNKNNKKKISEDESPRDDITLEKLNNLEPVFRKDGFVTAGNTPGLNDGAAALLMMSKERVEELNVKPLGYWKTCSMGNVEPQYMGLGPILAIRDLLAKTSLTFSDIDIFEINEAQAQQVLFCIRALGIDEKKVNVNGGAIAIGHPPGMTGARLILTALYELKRKSLKRAICSQCAGGGTGMATLIERF